MAKSVPSMLRNERLEGGDGFHVFGIRHLSPTGSFHLLQLLEQVQPTAVLVEGPSDATSFIVSLTMRGVVPPVALMAYTEQLPVRTLLYPFAEYSPEYQAFVWAAQNGAYAAFIDLPSGVSLAAAERRKGSSSAPAVGSEETSEAALQAEQQERIDRIEQRKAFYLMQAEQMERLVELAGEADYESYWERHFEHNTGSGTYNRAIREYSSQFRSLTEQAEWSQAPHEAAFNEVREAYMRRSVVDAIRAGHEQQRIVVVTGAHHASAIDLRLPAMTDEQLAALPRVATKLTLMPYSYYKLTTQSGYGAGNQAPAYFELFWQCLKRGDLARLPHLYMSSVAARLREQGSHRSTASVIEAVRLADALAALHDGSQPTWRDLRDAATVCLGNGELTVVAEALARTDIGTAIGSLPEGVSQTPIQDDLNRELKRLKLEKYRTTVATVLELDLRENRSVKSEEAAFLDLSRSTLFHRLELLGISFVRKQRLHQDSASWAENWVLRWTPEAEIETVESVLKGETVELASAFVLYERLERCEDIAEASRIIRQACDCALETMMAQALGKLQQLAVDAGSFEQVAAAAYELGVLIRYGSLRRLNTDELVPLLQQLFLRGTMLLVGAAACNDDAAREMVAAIRSFHAVAQDHYEVLEERGWLLALQELASRDDRNALLSGFAFAILLESNRLSEEIVTQEVSRRLSSGIPADIGAGWFEGMSMRNRYALLSRTQLWKELDAYIQTLEPEAFKRSLVFLRRAFGSFEPQEKAAVAEMMGELWGAGSTLTGAALQQPLSDEEKEKLDELNEFDFGDI
ncbi:DUF5682 family protein [Paenibacillus koleovorans]|uniref:DUF5682 family protein n=1 Tax=Paenibacillus koleovorans TaxID=121608 RepID=UPI001FE3EA3D|nr:DUF5682 family protein [Paenibacillus koleovorans]